MKKQNKAQAGLEGLMNVHVEALEKNSNEVVSLLEALSEKKLSKKDMEELKSIKRNLSIINDSLEDIANESEDEDTFDIGGLF